MSTKGGINEEVWLEPFLFKEEKGLIHKNITGSEVHKAMQRNITELKKFQEKTPS